MDDVSEQGITATVERMLKGVLVTVPILVALFGVLAAASEGAWFWVWGLTGVLLLALQTWLATRTAREARASREEFKVAMYDMLAPLARSLGRLAASKPADRRRLIGATIQTGLSCARGLTSADKVRATVYQRTTRGGQDAFVPHDSIGRGDPPRSTFVRGESEGDDVWEHVDQDRARFHRDVTQDPPPGWDATRVRHYRTFITVPIRSGDTAVGLLTVNAPHPGDLTDDDVGTMHVVASLLGTALSLVGNSWPVSTPRPSSTPSSKQRRRCIMSTPTGWSEQMDRKLEKMREDPDGYFREARASAHGETTLAAALRRLRHVATDKDAGPKD